MKLEHVEIPTNKTHGQKRLMVRSQGEATNIWSIGNGQYPHFGYTMEQMTNYFALVTTTITPLGLVWTQSTRLQLPSKHTWS